MGTRQEISMNEHHTSNLYNNNNKEEEEEEKVHSSLIFVLFCIAI